MISIHAAREGGDFITVAKHLLPVRFQSTPPVKAATGLINGRLSSDSISIHAAREGGDSMYQIADLSTQNFNPRRP